MQQFATSRVLNFSDLTPLSLRELVGFRLDRTGRLIDEASVSPDRLKRQKLECHPRTPTMASDELQPPLPWQDIN